MEATEANLNADPTNTELQTLVSELKEIIALTEQVIAEEKEKAQKASNATSTPTSTTPTTPATPYSYSPQPPEPQQTYRVGDNVSARWTSGDNGWYPARITSITGSAKAPVYIVKFAKYNVSETLNAANIKPASSSGVINGGINKKRKSSPGPSTILGGGPNVPHSAVISRPANVDGKLAEERRRVDSGGMGERAKVVKKLKHGKELNEGKKKWLEFASKGVKMGGVGKKKLGESSMFRTPDGVHGRGKGPF